MASFFTKLSYIRWGNNNTTIVEASPIAWTSSDDSETISNVPYVCGILFAYKYLMFKYKFHENVLFIMFYVWTTYTVAEIYTDTPWAYADGLAHECLCCVVVDSALQSQ